MLVASSYPFLDVFWTMLIFFLWVAWFCILFRVIADIFRRHDIGGGAKVLWFIFVILVPFLGVFIYVIAESRGMEERSVERAQASQQQYDDYLRATRFKWRRRRGDRQGEATARQRRDHTGRVRRDQSESACLIHRPKALPHDGRCRAEQKRSSRPTVTVHERLLCGG